MYNSAKCWGVEKIIRSDCGLYLRLVGCLEFDLCKLVFIIHVALKQNNSTAASQLLYVMKFICGPLWVATTRWAPIFMQFARYRPYLPLRWSFEVVSLEFRFRIFFFARWSSAIRMAISPSPCMELVDWQPKRPLSCNCSPKALGPTLYSFHGVRHVPWTGFLNGASIWKQYVFLPFNGSKYYLMYTFKAVHVLGIFDPSASLYGGAALQESIWKSVILASHIFRHLGILTVPQRFVGTRY